MPGISAIPVCVFAKPPVAGEAKTRLAKAIGAECAARLAKAFFSDIWASVTSLPNARPVLATTVSDPSIFDLPADVEVWLQGGGDLGERMERTLARAVMEAGRGVVVGSDIPDLPPAQIEAAINSLGEYEGVVGPTQDGGFYLLALSCVPDGLLSDLPWSTTATCKRTEQRLSARGIHVTRTAPWFDIDEAHDLVLLRQRLRTTPRAAPATRTALTTIASGAE